MLLISRTIFEVINIIENDHFNDIHCCQVTQKLLNAFSKTLQWMYSVLLQFSADIYFVIYWINGFSFLIFFTDFYFFNYDFCISTHQILQTESLFMNPNYEFSSISEPSNSLKYKNQRKNRYIQFLFSFYFLFFIFQKSFCSRLQCQIKIRD